MSDKDSMKLYAIGDTVIVESEGGVMECKLIDCLKEDQLYVEEKASKFRFIVSSSKIKKKKWEFMAEAAAELLTYPL